MMNASNRITSLAGSLATCMALACGSGTFDLAPPSARSTVEKAPDWMLNVPVDDDHLSAAATATSRDFQLAVDKAHNLALVDIGRQLGSHMKNLTRQFQEETGLAADSQLLTEFSSVTKAMVDETLVGARIARRRLISEGNIYRAFVLVELPIGDANLALAQKLKSDEALYTRFRATRAYAELDDEVQAARGTGGH